MIQNNWKMDGNRVSDVRRVFRCRRAAPALSAGGTSPQASSSCGSGAERRQMMRIQNTKRDVYLKGSILISIIN